MVENMESVEANEPVESPKLVEIHLLKNSIPRLLPSSSEQPQPLPSPTPPSPIIPPPETQLINPTLPRNTTEKIQTIPLLTEEVEIQKREQELRRRKDRKEIKKKEKEH